MKKVFTMLMLALSINAFAQYTNATLNGPWFIYTSPISPYGDSLLYVVFDGVGGVTDMSGFATTISGSYTVASGGAFSGTLSIDGSPYPFSGQLSSQDAGTITIVGSNMLCARVANQGALKDTLVGLLYTQSCGQRSVTIAVNNLGIVTYCAGLTGPVTGRAYTNMGIFMCHLRTGESGGWNQLSFMGYYANDSLKGQVGLDQTGCGISNAKLKRISIPLSVNEISETGRISIFPNPSNGNFQIKNESDTDAKVKILNGIGDVVFEQTSPQHSSSAVDLSELPKGIYFVQTFGSGKIHTEKIVIR